MWLLDLFRGKQQAALDRLTGLLQQRGGSLVLPSPLGRSFLVSNDAAFLRRVLVTSQARYSTSDVRGVETFFRANELPNGLAAFRVMHEQSTRFPIGDAHFNRMLRERTDAWLPPLGADTPAELDLASFARSLWGDGLTHVLFGRGVPGLADEVRVGFEALLGRLGSPWVHAIPGFVHVPTPANRQFHSSVQRARAAVAEQVARGADTDWCVMASLARASSPAFTEADRLEIAMAFFFNSFATVSSTLAWLLWHIAADPELQRGLCAEMSELPNSPGAVGARPLLDAALAETLRLYSPIHLGRHALEDDAVDGEPRVRAGTDVISNAWLIHRNPAVWPEPHVFRAERFLERRVHFSQYLPFSMGPRGCPGRQLSYAVIKQVVLRVLEQRELDVARAHDGAPLTVPEFQRSLVVPTLPSALPVRVAPAARARARARPLSAARCPHAAASSVEAP